MQITQATQVPQVAVTIAQLAIMQLTPVLLIATIITTIVAWIIVRFQIRKSHYQVIKTRLNYTFPLLALIDLCTANKYQLDICFLKKKLVIIISKFRFSYFYSLISEKTNEWVWSNNFFYSFVNLDCLITIFFFLFYS